MNFIEKCIEGFLLQKTNFNIEIIIHDDASQDNTDDVIKEYQNKYPKKIKGIYQTKNQLSQDKSYLLKAMFKHCSGKYIALCEGDDYWTDENKLQKQVDFLEANPEYSVCWTKYGVLNLNGNIGYEDWLDFFKGEDKLEVSLNNFFNPYATHTLTTVFKKEALNLAAFKKMKYFKDYTLFCMCLSNGKGAVLNFSSAIYRVHSNGAYSGLSNFNKCYSNYQTLREIVKEVPNCNIGHLKKFRNKALLQSFEISIFNKEVGLKKNFSLYLKVLVHSPVRKKMQATITMAKQLYGMRKDLLRISSNSVI